jgi:hypothetical protein
MADHKESTMAKSRTTVRKMWAQDPDAPNPNPIRCAIFGCHDNPMFGTYVCIHHAVEISDDVTEMYERMSGVANPRPMPTFPPFVYYLMLGPATVKIGTTRDVTARVQQLRSELQYVVALERGSYELERQRHLQFADERLGLKEDFRLSDRLKAHVEALMPDRDEILKEATARRSPVRNRRPAET